YAAAHVQAGHSFAQPDAPEQSFRCRPFDAGQEPQPLGPLLAGSKNVVIGAIPSHATSLEVLSRKVTRFPAGPLSLALTHVLPAFSYRAPPQVRRINLTPRYSEPGA